MTVSSRVMADCYETLESGLDDMAIVSSVMQRELLIKYLMLMVKWNRAYNLTSAQNPLEVVTRHLLDSLSVVPFLYGNKILDVGTGAGLPGIPLAIMNPEMHFVLLDSNGKRIRFIDQVCIELELCNISTVQARVEMLNIEVLFDSIIARAFSNLSLLWTLTSPLIRPSGCVLAMKGTERSVHVEMALLENVSSETYKLTVPNLDEERHMVIMRKSCTIISS